MLKSTTKTSNVRRLKAPVRERRMVKKRLDTPMMMARVPSMENRSFHMLIGLSSEETSKRKHYLSFAVFCWFFSSIDFKERKSIRTLVRMKVFH